MELFCVQRYVEVKHLHNNHSNFQLQEELTMNQESVFYLVLMSGIRREIKILINLYTFFFLHNSYKL